MTDFIFIDKHGCDFDSPSSAHAALKHLIEKIVNEAMTLPNLKEALHSSPNGIVNEDEDFTNKTYEDILATAILNKVNKILLGNVIGNISEKREIKLIRRVRPGRYGGEVIVN